MKALIDIKLLSLKLFNRVCLYKGGIVTFVCCFILCTLLFLSGCIYGEDNIFSNEKHDMNVIHGEDIIVMEDERVFSGISKPALDRDIPQKLETATFAMG